MRNKLIEVQDLHAGVENLIAQRQCYYMRSINLNIHRSELVAVVGESGSGKTKLLMSIGLLLRDQPGIRSGRLSYYFDGATHQLDFANGKCRQSSSIGDRVFKRDLGRSELEAFRRKHLGPHIAYLLQGAKSALHPYRTVDEQLNKALSAHIDIASERAAAVDELLAQFDIENVRKSYPHSLSGGQAYRVMICLGISKGCDLMLADEPTTGIDSPMMLIIMKYLLSYSRNNALEHVAGSSARSVMIVTHQIESIQDVADRVFVMYSSQLLEYYVNDGKEMPHHPYTKLLLEIAEDVYMARENARLLSVEGQMPSLYKEKFEGCVFCDRCPIVEEQCRHHAPMLRELGPGHAIACHLVGAE
jgi:oligopeptide/dipeptide ABC transporter ATP-binding protein